MRTQIGGERPERGSWLGLATKSQTRGPEKGPPLIVFFQGASISVMSPFPVFGITTDGPDGWRECSRS